MPCGGIYPIKGSWVEKYLTPEKARCYVCGKGGTDHFCDEWDTDIHYECVPAFLNSEDGKVVISHGHSIYLEKALSEPTT